MNLTNKKKAELIALIEKLQKDGIALHSENIELTEKVSTAKRKINSYVSQIHELTEENKQLHEKISADKEYYNALTQENNALTQENKALNEEIKNLYKKISTNRAIYNQNVIDLQKIAADAMKHRNQVLLICGCIILLFVIVILFVL